MADDLFLRLKIQRGELAALVDPSLPLHLLADGPTVAWWQEGQARCACALVQECGWGLEHDRITLAAGVASWGRFLSKSATMRPRWGYIIGKLRTEQDMGKLSDLLDGLPGELVNWVEGRSIASLALSLARDLWPMMPSPLPSTVDPHAAQALEVLTLYLG